jgi:hypothetical protein
LRALTSSQKANRFEHRTVPLPLAANVRLFGCAIHEGIPQMLRLLVILSKDSTIAFYGAIFSAVAITALFLGSESRKTVLARQCLFPIFCSRWSQFILLAQG